jgi:formylglycine-generating enzyme required for sulfatase activity
MRRSPSPVIAGGARERLSTIAGLALAGIGACSPSELPAKGQVLLHVDTDGTVASSSIPRIGVDPIPLFDTLLAEVYEPGQTAPCAGCSREFALDADRFRQGQVSFGIPTAAGVGGYVARLRMYPSRATLSGEPPGPNGSGNPPNSVVDVTVALPLTSSEGILDRTVFLATDSVGVPAGSLDAPLDTMEGLPGPSQVGTWAGAQVTPCSGAPPAGAVCIPGGAFWMGNAKVLGGGVGDAANELRLVVLPPFFIDSTEVTLARVRAADIVPDYSWDGSNSGNAFQDYCTYTPQAMGEEDTPVNCMSWPHARAFCQGQGGDLPSEVQFEFVASAFSGRLYAWGDDDPSCDDAVLGRAGYGLLASLLAPCSPSVAPGGPLPIGADIMPPRRDLLVLPTGTVYDLVGNMCEFSRDMWNRQDEPCWSGPGVYTDPVCEKPSPADGAKHVYRGGCWDITANLATSASREGLVDDATTGLIGLGFRCARSAAGP